MNNITTPVNPVTGEIVSPVPQTGIGPAVAPTQVDALPTLQLPDVFDYESVGQIFQSPYVAWKYDEHVEGTVVEVQLVPQWKSNHTTEHLNRTLSPQEYGDFYDLMYSLEHPVTGKIRYVKNNMAHLKILFSKNNVQKGDYVRIKVLSRPRSSNEGYQFSMEVTTPNQTVAAAAPASPHPQAPAGAVSNGMAPAGTVPTVATTPAPVSGIADPF